jgi:Response regulator containing CheY-like receiver, AAA-type ATPase, and DNA-binding domains
MSNKIKILIIEPDLSFCLVLEDLIKKNSYIEIGEVRTTDMGNEGMSLLTTNHYDYIFISDELLDFKGATIIEYINRYYFRHKLQIVALTNNAELPNLIKLIEAGATSFIDKRKLTLQRIDRLFNPVYNADSSLTNYRF